MRTLFYPRSVVIVGVSDAPHNLGRTIVENLERFSFPGRVHLVGRNGGRLGGRPIHRTLEEVPDTPDLAVILIPAPYVPDALEVCGRLGIRRVVIESGGFGEYAEERREDERRLLDIAERYGIRFVGPNCISIVNLDNGLVLPFMAMDPAAIRKGPVSLISQSGGVVFGGIKLFSCENLGVNKLISMGNKLDLDENDYLEYLIRDPGTRIIALYLESITDGRRLMNLAASTDKPIVVLKANTAPTSHEIARFHTAALAGDETVCDAALAQAGMHRVHSLSELAALLKGFQLPPMAGPNLAVIGRSGGQIVMAADAAAANGFRLVRFPDSLLEKIRSRVRAGVIRLTNPLDLGDVFDLGFYADVVEAALAQPEVHGVLLQHLHSRGKETEATLELLRAVRDLSSRYEKPVAVCFMTERDEWFTVKTATDFPLFLEPAEALRALAASRRHAQNTRKPVPLTVTGPRSPAGTGRVAEAEETFARLAAAGLRVPPYAFAGSADKALQAADRLGYPVALKIASAEIVHKTEAGGVRVGVRGRRELERALEDMKARFGPLLTDGRAVFLVQRMAPSGVEVLLGTKHDPEFGPVVLFGMGGVFVEVYRDVAVRVAPVSESEAAEMIAEVRGSLLLEGFRGHPRADVAALARTIAAFSRIPIGTPDIVELEINPLLVLEEGRGCVAVDARMRVRTPEPSTRADVRPAPPAALGA
ncbi:acetate--CoA ligase family protein [Deferrisoma sp.]